MWRALASVTARAWAARSAVKVRSISANRARGKNAMRPMPSSAVLIGMGSASMRTPIFFSPRSCNVPGEQFQLLPDRRTSRQPQRQAGADERIGGEQRHVQIEITVVKRRTFPLRMAIHEGLPWQLRLWSWRFEMAPAGRSDLAPPRALRCEVGGLMWPQQLG